MCVWKEKGNSVFCPHTFLLQLSNLSNGSLICIKKLKCDTLALNTDSVPNCKMQAFDSLLPYFLCCVSTRQLLSLKWHPSTSKEKRKHTPSWRASPPFHSFSQFCWAVALWSLASLTRLPNLMGHMSFSSFKYLAGNALNGLYGKSAKNTFFSVGIFQRGIKDTNFRPFPREHVCMVQDDGLRCLFIEQKAVGLVVVWASGFCSICLMARGGLLPSLR